ncbi:hypothetical protein REPUB_Repub16aG0019000 [Reevesia pubescens]
MASTKTTLLLLVLYLFVISEIAGPSVHLGAASHGSRRCALKHATLAAKGAMMGACLQALRLTEMSALAMPK